MGHLFVMRQVWGTEATLLMPSKASSTSSRAVYVVMPNLDPEDNNKEIPYNSIKGNHSDELFYMKRITHAHEGL